MSLRVRIRIAGLALIYTGLVQAESSRFYAGHPNAAMLWLLWSPIAACALNLVGAALRLRWLQAACLAFLVWRSLWMFFSWDGLLLFPALCLLALPLPFAVASRLDCA